MRERGKGRPSWEQYDLLTSGAAKEAFDDIQDAAEGLDATFACGGVVICSQPIKIIFGESVGASKIRSLELPTEGACDEALTDLTELCSAATFGKTIPEDPLGGADVLDTSYRKALKLDPDCFATNLDLAELGILEQVKTVLAPDAAYLRAVLYKLNIYQTGDFFKAHVDTPRDEHMLGSLVIALPSIHTGGALTVEHGGVVHTFDWSLESPPAEALLQWGAFYSDCKHEVHEVTSGARITLTYNLISEAPCTPLLQGVDIGGLALCQSLRVALQTPGFLEDGGSLAFGCQHAYAHNSSLARKQPIETQLKGADACLHAVATELGLRVAVEPVYRRSYTGGETESDSEIEADSIGDVYIGGSFGLRLHQNFSEEADVREISEGRGATEAKELIWCRGLAHKEVADIYLTTHYHYYMPIHAIQGSALQGLGMSGSKRKLEEGVESLAAMASRAVLKHINAADGRHATFAFGGAVECPHPIQVIVPLDILKPKVPGLEPAQERASTRRFERLFSFGGSTPEDPSGVIRVVDPLPKSTLHASGLVTNIDLTELGVLHRVKTLMAPEAADIRAELCRLDIHQTGDSFGFRPDTDFPKKDDLLGVLVIVLPSTHTGGALVVKHGDILSNFDFSCDSLPLKPLLQWGAFHCDCELKAQEVTSGVRITLVYNLYSVPMTKEPMKGLNASGSALYKTLKGALETPGFLEEGGTLAFGCQHAYAHNSKATVKAGIETRLKGADACLFAVAQQLGLKAQVRPVYRKKGQYGPDTDSDASDEDERRWNGKGEFVGRDFGLCICGRGEDYEESTDAYGAAAIRGARQRRDLLWCRSMTHRDMALAYATYGNEFVCQYLYTFAAILVKVPPAAKRTLRPPTEDDF